MRFLFLFIFILSVYSSFAQSISDLNKEKELILTNISHNANLIDEYDKRKNSELTIISLLDQKLLNRKKLISTYNYEIYTYNKQIESINNVIDSLDRQISKVKSDYAKCLNFIYLNKFYSNPLLFIFSGSSISDSYNKVLFLRNVNIYKRSQKESLDRMSSKYDSLQVSINNKKNSVLKLLNQVSQETLLIKTEYSSRQLLIDSLTHNVSNLYSIIQKDQARANELEKTILKLIQEEAERAKKLRENNKISKEESVLYSNITEAKGHLKWPSSKYVVVSNFGEHEHPLLPNVIVRNNGIDLDVLDSHSIFPVFDGIVSKVIVIPGSNISVIIRHGAVLTVYSNLSKVFVKKDDNVTTSTQIGLVENSTGLNSNILHFELWDGESKQNPLLWLEN
ncbi:MAG: hypothetical protein E7069_08800 [Bacteroidales bacterium]|jgi:murein DD-endopeptidase MepM/ murein hydrolase activator NlpD|nr:hypothetical protein [Bacteroidales bacterium]